jgi:hypothetical protein
VTLEQLLNELAKNVLRDRSALVSGPTDRLWDDETLISYIDDAQKRFARRSLCLRDETTEDLTQIVLETGTKRYVLHPRVVSVISARYDTDSADLTRINHTTLAGQRRPDDWTGAGWNPTPANTPGRPLAYWTDEGVSIESASRVLLYVDRAPTVDENGKIVFMRVVRGPIADLTIDDLDASPEIPEDYHLDLLDWAAYRALRNDESDGALSKAETFKRQFERVLEEVRQEALRKMHAPIGWAFGQNGFAWTGN